MNDERLERRYEADAIAARVAEVAAALDRDFGNRHLVLISILKGSSFLLADLARRIDSPVACEYISVRREEDSDQVLQIDFRTEFAMGTRPILLLKDVVGTGVIESYLIDHLEAQGASSIKLAAIIDKPEERTTDVVVDYPLFSAPHGVFAGYGMEFQGRHAQLPYIVEVLRASLGVAASRPRQ
jgi:hypoxanthine phosphoribosyltransferase